MARRNTNKDPGRRSKIFGALTGRSGASVSSGRAAPDVRGLLLAAYGLNKRGGLNTADAAKDLGVTQRTVQRWVATEGRQRIGKPKADTLQKLAKKSRQAATTQRGRKAALASFRGTPKGKALANRGGHLRIRGHQGPSAAGKTYKRDRQIQLELTPADVEAMWSAFEQNGDEGVSKWMTNHADEQYVAGWEFERSDEMGIDRP